MAVNWSLAAWITYRVGADYGTLPDRIPTHFDLNGRPDNYGSKAVLWLLPAILWAECILFSVLMRFPQVYNMPRKAEVRALPASLRDTVYEAYNEMLAAILLAMAVLFAALSGAMRRAVDTHQLDLSPGWVLVWLCTLAGLTAYFIVRNARLVKRQLAASGGVPPSG